MVYTSNRDGGGSVPSGHLAHPPPEGRLRRTGIFITVVASCKVFKDAFMSLCLDAFAAHEM